MTIRVSLHKKRTVGGWKVTFHPEDLRTLLEKWQEVLASGSRVKAKRACDVSTENIDGSSSARFPTVTSEAKWLNGTEAARTLKTASVRKRSCSKTSASIAGL